MEADQDPWEIAEEISRKPHKILIAIRHRGGDAKTSSITSDTDIDAPLANYHLKNLMRAGLVKRHDEGDPASVQRDGYNYHITDRGKEVLTATQEDYNLTPIEEGEVRRRFDDLEARVEKLEQENKQLRSVLYDSHENYETLDEWVGAIRDNVVLLQEKWRKENQD
ncbi:MULTISPECIES: hypothetical protein [Natrialbaceae]|uniref:hypothetical protein n=1 Tax=Natrialbaceae TaxID=1644061 RepID=UPI00207CD454|nr:hypothetical protein [Natronococcus sp. CG52]